MSIDPKTIEELKFSVSAGIQSVQCECGWEAVFVVPEEHEKRAGAIMDHIARAHQIPVPMFTVTMH